MPDADKLVYVRIPQARGGRAEMVRMVYALAGRPYEDAWFDPSGGNAELAGKNPYKQLPFVLTPSGEVIYQSIAIMHHAAHGSPAWPADPAALTRALSVALGAYDLYQAFSAFSADDVEGRKKFEARRAPQYFGALGEIYAARPFAAGDAPSFADCIAHQAVTWCVRRNEVCQALFAASPALRGFIERFEAVPAIRAFLDRQQQARQADPSL